METSVRQATLFGESAHIPCPDCGENLNGKHRERDPTTGEDLCFGCRQRRKHGLGPARQSPVQLRLL